MPSESDCPALEALSRFLLGQLSFTETRHTARHLRLCEPCLGTVRALRGQAGPVPSDPAERERIVQAIMAGLGPASNPPEEAQPAAPDASQTGTVVFAQPVEPVTPMTVPAIVPVPPSADRKLLGPPQGPGEIGRLGPYRVLKQLGVGGMGVVFQAEDVQLKRAVALKVMKPEYGSDRDLNKRFLREARAVAAIDHENIVTIYQVGEDRGTPYIAMQYLRGESLNDRLEREKKLPIPEVIRIGKEIAAGLNAAHKAGLIHRDIKPANIWLEGERGRVKILDFGLARNLEDVSMTRTGAVMGTPEYMSPEQARGKKVDKRSDLFSLGSVMYDMCSGRPPFHAPETMAVLLNVATQVPRALVELNPDAPQTLIVTIVRLMAKHLDDRIQTAEEVVRTLGKLERALEAGPVAPAPEPTSGPGRKLALAAACAAAALLAYLFGGDLVKAVDAASDRAKNELRNPK